MSAPMEVNESNDNTNNKEDHQELTSSQLENDQGDNLKAKKDEDANKKDLDETIEKVNEKIEMNEEIHDCLTEDSIEKKRTIT